MQNLKEISRSQNMPKSAEYTKYALDTQSPILAPTSYRQVKPKIEINLCERFEETRWLYNQYGLKAPTWLRRAFVLNQYRRKSLNDNLLEAQLDKAFCGRYAATDEWYDQLHSVWHDINRRPSCCK